MKLKLEPLTSSNLTNMEVGQLIHRHLSDLATIDPALLTDESFNAYLNDLGLQLTEYQKGLVQVQKSDDTEKIVLADAYRDKAVVAFGIALKLYAYSDNPIEAKASRSLSNLFDKYKNLASLNYEAETLGIDKLVSELLSPTYSGKVSILQMLRYVTRLQNANENFKPLFSSRMVSAAMAASYDMKLLRAGLLNKYSDFAEYVLSMAKATNKPLFDAALNLLNTARKYYNDQVARRIAPKADKPVT